MVTKSSSLAALAFVLLSSAFPAFGNVKVSVDRDPLSLNESFELRFELDFDLSTTPDFSPLEQNFEILAHSQQTTVTMLNAKIERREIHTLELMPRRIGALTVPAIEFDGESSRPLTVTVQKQTAAAPASDDAIVEVEISSQQTYPQAQTICTVRLYRGARFASATLSEPQLPGADAIIEKLGEDVSYDTVRDGRRFLVTERRYAVFPQRPGRFQFEPISFEGQVVQGSRSLLFDYGARGRSLRVQSKPAELIVEPIPAEAEDKHWLPAQSVTLDEEWSEQPESVPVGEPVTRTITLTVKGQTAAQLPAISSGLPASIKSYPDQAQLHDKPQSDGIIAIRQEKVALVPSSPGVYELPAVRLPWWDIEAHTLKYAELPPRTIKVVGAAAGDAESLPQAGTPSPQPAAESTDIQALQRRANPWPWISLALLVGWMLSLLLIRRQRESKVPTAFSRDDRQASRSKLEKQLSAACRTDHAHRAEAVLLQIAATTWPDQPPRALHTIARHSDEPLRGALLQLEQHRYGPLADSWSGEKFWAAYREAPLRAPAERSTGGHNRLEPLYPKV